MTRQTSNGKCQTSVKQQGPNIKNVASIVKGYMLKVERQILSVMCLKSNVKGQALDVTIKPKTSALISYVFRFAIDFAFDT